jgi:AraC-like DNA-binding protein
MISPSMRIRLHRTRQCLAETGGTSPPLTEIARAANVSTSHLIRRFTAVFGETPHQFRTRMRLEHARRLLILEQASVTEVCLALGFSSLGSFSSLFHRHYGEPPSSCRRRLHPSLEVPGFTRSLLSPDCLSLMTAAWSSGQFSRSTEPGRPLG